MLSSVYAKEKKNRIGRIQDTDSKSPMFAKETHIANKR